MAKRITKSAKQSLPGPDDIYRVTLSNGITVLARSSFDSPSISMGGYLPAGAIFESDAKLGLADFVSSSLMRGTQARTFDAIYNELESVGASMGFDSGVHNTSFGGRTLVEDLPLLLSLLSESLQTPTFPANEVEKLRAQLLTGLAIRAQDTSDVAAMAFDRMLFTDHPYGRPSDGFVETIQSITQKDMQEFHRAHFGPKGMIIAIVGAIEPEKAVAEVERVLGGWQVPGQVSALDLPAHKPVKKTIKHHPDPGTDRHRRSNGPAHDPRGKKTAGLQHSSYPGRATRNFMPGHCNASGKQLCHTRHRTDTVRTSRPATGSGDGADAQYSVWGCRQPHGYR